MKPLTTVSTLACAALLGTAAPLLAGTEHGHNPANTISTA